MDETKYGKYIVTRPKANVPPSGWGSGDLETPDRVTRVAFLDKEVLAGAFYTECVWRWKESPEGHQTKPHTHDFDEVLAFFGTDPRDPFDLCGEVELWLGDEKHIITKSCVVFVPKGLKHCPLIFKRVDMPIFHFSTGPSQMYGGEKK